ncbi:hypothetical protein HDU82_002266 [Entophlyctis luteolus]|nr:hypothetical protein HDU82_002266 [Entophlyctis luteolus]
MFSWFEGAALAAGAVVCVATVMFYVKAAPENGFPTAKNPTLFIGHVIQMRNYAVFRKALSEESVGQPAGQEAVNVDMLGTKTVGIFGLDAAKWVLGKTGTIFHVQWFPRWIRLLGARSISVANDPNKHKRLRALAGHAISKEVLEDSYPQLRANAQKLLKSMSTQDSVYVFDYCKQFTFAAIVSFFFRSRQEDVDRMMLQHNNFIALIDGFMDVLFPEWMNGPFTKGLKAKEEIDKITRQIVLERQALQGVEFNDGLSKLMNAVNEEGEGLSTEEIVDNIDALVFAGNDTTAATITSALYYYVYEMDPSERDMLDREILEHHDAEIEQSSLSALPVLDAFTKELLRIKNPISASMRVVAVDDAEVLGRRLKKGDAVGVLNSMLGFDESIFPEATVFKISRFLVDDAVEKNRLSSSYLPFGHGPRQCLGMALGRLEIKIFMFEMIRNFKASKGVGKLIESTGAVVFINSNVRISARGSE